MTDTAPLPLDVIQTNLQTQQSVSERVIVVVNRLAAAAKDRSNSVASPEIAPELRELLEASEDLRQSANTVANAVVTTLRDAG